ncbi:hypothetical protein PVAP13_8KG285532 [Panicum virgatum]|uniref:Uncharacterized protein n=1 Tax=Panicum virgatum TaxID=38727 RepID=A0A8T0PR78_PANVG|nr:hypothetical protein PVAP13_8KG285532 [Panicum virgatum]
MSKTWCTYGTWRSRRQCCCKSGYKLTICAEVNIRPPGLAASTARSCSRRREHDGWPSARLSATPVRRCPPPPRGDPRSARARRFTCTHVLLFQPLSVLKEELRWWTTASMGAGSAARGGGLPPPFPCRRPCTRKTISGRQSLGKISPMTISQRLQCCTMSIPSIDFSGQLIYTFASNFIRFQ